MIERTLTYNELGLTAEEIYEAIGTRGMSDAEISRLTDEISGFLRARLAFVTTGMTQLEAFTAGKIITSQLRGSEALCWFVATAGQEFEAFQRRLMQEGDMVRVYLANEIGSLLAEKTADAMEKALEEQLEPKGLKHTNRFSPGYCGWPVKEQPILFSLFPTEPCGIVLTDSALMIPIKSVSGVIGIGHNVRRNDYSCGICGMEKCYKNRMKKNTNEKG